MKCKNIELHILYEKYKRKINKKIIKECYNDLNVPKIKINGFCLRPL